MKEGGLCLGLASERSVHKVNIGNQRDVLSLLIRLGRDTHDSLKRHATIQHDLTLCSNPPPDESYHNPLVSFLPFTKSAGQGGRGGKLGCVRVGRSGNRRTGGKAVGKMSKGDQGRGGFIDEFEVSLTPLVVTSRWRARLRPRSSVGEA